jgi:hypothetical protein
LSLYSVLVSSFVPDLSPSSRLFPYRISYFFSMFFLSVFTFSFFFSVALYIFISFFPSLLLLSSLSSSLFFSSICIFPDFLYIQSYSYKQQDKLISQRLSSCLSQRVIVPSWPVPCNFVEHSGKFFQHHVVGKVSKLLRLFTNDVSHNSSTCLHK